MRPSGHETPHPDTAQSEIFTLIPANVGPRLATTSGGAAYSLRPAGKMVFSSTSHFAAIMLSPSPGMRSAFGSDKLHNFDAAPGMLIVSPANVESTAIWSNARENIVLSFDHQALEQLAAREMDIDLPALEPLPFGTVDQTALKIGQALQQELAAEAPNDILVDALITVFSVHLLRKYRGGRPASLKGQLSYQKRNILEDYLRANLGRKLTIAELSAVCGLSPTYFIHSFTRTYGKPPHRYIIELRLNAAEDLLRSHGLSIAQVAYATGFNSQSHLTTTMRKHRGTTPALLRS